MLLVLLKVVCIRSGVETLCVDWEAFTFRKVNSGKKTILVNYFIDSGIRKTRFCQQRSIQVTCLSWSVYQLIVGNYVNKGYWPNFASNVM